MDKNSIDVEKLKLFWLTEAEEAFRFAEHLMEKEDYSYALFFGHLALEKILKSAYVCRLGEHAPPIHNLLRLSRSVGFEPDETKTDALIRITAFNIEARYPDVKRAFRQKCTQDFTNEQMKIIKEIYEWVKSQLP